MEIVPYTQSHEYPGARRMPDAAATAFRRELEVRCGQASDDAFLAANWLRFCRSKRHYYFSVLRGHGFPIQLINRLTHYTDHLYSRHALLALLNIVRCEGHREVLLSILSEK
jgi:hypothetical protein